MLMKKVLAGTFGSIALAAASTAFAVDNNGGGVGSTDAPVGSLLGNKGLALCNAAINSNGTVAGGSGVNTDPAQTLRLGVGTYQVAFGGLCANGVLIANGWYRWVQPDTLTSGTLASRTCITADRAGVQRAVWVQCYDGTGNLADTSFVLFIQR